MDSRGTYTGIDVETLSKVHIPPIVGGVAALHVIEVKDEQPEKALSPMLVTLSPIVTEVKDEQSRKAFNPMPFT
jgi:hypothetical protein